MKALLHFKTLTLSDIPVVKPFLKWQDSRICDYSIGGIFMWRDYFKTYFTIYRNTLIFKVKYLGGVMAFPVPIGENPAAAMDQIEDYCRRNGLPLIYCTVPAGALPALKRRYPALSAEPNRDWFDYLYRTEDLLSFRGRKFDGQRNHIHRFQRLCPGYSFREITDGNLDAVRSFYAQFAEEHQKASPVAREESAKTMELLERYGQYGLFGGFLWTGDRIAGVSIGEIVGDTLFVHVEKADTRYTGVYQVLVQEFLKHFATERTVYVNREEDVGDAGLRKSKFSYHPAALLEKSTVRAFPGGAPVPDEEKGGQA